MTVKKQLPQKIFDSETEANIGIALWDEETLQAITKNSGEHAVSNEYQVHYWAVVVRIKGEDGSFLDISIPTVIFNYEQFVNPAHIDFELKDVDEVSNPIKVLHNVGENELVPHIQEFLGNLGVEYELIATNLNSMHRHPGGRRQSFSGTDYQMKPDADTGIVFPLAQGENKPNFASIIAHDQGKTYLAHNEYRIATGDATADDGKIIYTQGRCAGIVRAPVHKVSSIEKLFGYEDKEQSYIVLDNLSVDQSNIFIEIERWWNELDYRPNTDFVKPENVKKKVYKSYTPYKYNQPAKSPAKQTQMDFNKSYKEKTKNQVEQEAIPLVVDLDAVVVFAQESFDLKIPSVPEIMEMAQDEINDLFYNFEIYYYNIAEEDLQEAGNDYELLEALGLTMEDPSMEDMIELYNNVVEEISEIIDNLEDDGEIIYHNIEYEDIDVKRKELINMGASAFHIQAASDSQIEHWHNQMFGEGVY